MQGQTEPLWLAVGSYVPTSPTTWVVFIALFIALVALRYGFTKLATQRQSAKLTELMRDSAAFADRWPIERLQYAPYGELNAEAERCPRIIALMRQLRAAKRGDRNYLDSQIVAVEGWLANVHTAMDTAGPRSYWKQAPRSQEPPGNA